MSKRNVTILDCMFMYVAKDMITVINNGEVKGFEYEKALPQTDNQQQCQAAN